jgi:SagB-type dehydrogenase family enzyme
MSQALDQVLLYHRQTKHRLNAYARGPGRLDWANQPDPFRRYIGSPHIMLDREEPLSKMTDKVPGSVPVHLSMQSLSSFFFDSLALSAWKSAGGSTWPLRVNPSSGNLHPTEGYLIAGEIDGLDGSPGIFHYTPEVHGLELRSNLSKERWEDLGLPKGTFLIAISSIYWRESWKYGERAFRYSMTDVGHALAALGISASCLGWQAWLLEETGTQDLSRLLGMTSADREEAEHPDCLLAIFTDGEMHDIVLAHNKLSNLIPTKFQGEPNILSVEHINWSIIEDAASATIKAATEKNYEKGPSKGELPSPDFCKVVRKRRSAQAMDRRTAMPFEAFCDILRFTLPDTVPFNLLPWKPRVHLVLFVHRIEDLDSGLYMLVRDREQTERLMAAASSNFSWERSPVTPLGLDLYLLQEGDARHAARESSCRQDIASDGCFAVAMLSEFEKPLQEIGAWFYPRLYWECGMIGQSLYLGAETKGFRGCGVGCYFDDAVHEMLGLKGWAFQDLYHFTVGKAIDDTRIMTLPAYE